MAEGRKKTHRKVYNLIFTMLAVVVMWAVWLIAYFAEGNDYVIPSFSTTAAKVWELLGDAEFWGAFGNTLLRTLEAFVLAYASAVLFAVLSCFSAALGAVIRPIVAVLRTIPTMAIILILLLWTTPLIAPIAVAFLVTFPLVYTQLCAAFSGVDKKVVEMAAFYGVPRLKRVFKIYVPAVLPNVLSQAGAAFSLTLKVIVSAEVMSRTYRSVGGLMQDARNYLEISELFALTLITVVAGAMIEWGLGKLTLITRKWTDGSCGAPNKGTAELNLARKRVSYNGKERILANVKRKKYGLRRRRFS